MPFLGKDWRSPGEQWIRTDDGWQKMKIWRFRFLENLNENIVSRLLALLEGEYHDVTATYQPYVFIPKRTSRENTIWPSLCDSLNRLDIFGAVKDRRRQDYVWKLLQLLIKNKLRYMSVDAQKQMFNIIEQLLNQVIKTQTKPLQMQKLLCALGHALEENTYHHLGTYQLWDMHMETLGRLQGKLNTLKINDLEEGLTLSDLPEEILRLILDRLSDHSDIVHMGMTNKHLLPLVDRPLWKRLCIYHFKQSQIDHEVNKMKTRRKKLNGNNNAASDCNVASDSRDLNCNDTSNDTSTAMNEEDWRIIYRKLYCQFGRKEDYIDSICLCSFCSCLFWKHLGHPCFASQSEEVLYKTVSPQELINLFPL